MQFTQVNILSSIKNMALLFEAFDRDTYEIIVQTILLTFSKTPNKFNFFWISLPHYSIEAYKNFIRQMFPERFSCSIKSNTVIQMLTIEKKHSANVFNCTISANRMLSHYATTELKIHSEAKKPLLSNLVTCLTFHQMNEDSPAVCDKWHTTTTQLCTYPVRRQKLLTMSDIKSSCKKSKKRKKPYK